MSQENEERKKYDMRKEFLFKNQERKNDGRKAQKYVIEINPSINN